VLVQMKEITKRFPGVIANEAVDFELKAGEVHALLGENGAGKSTLMSVLTGLYRPDEGELSLEGRPVRFASPRDAIAAGVGMVHQHFKLVGPLTVAENVVMGEAGGLLLNRKAIARKIREVSEAYNLKVDPEARVDTLSVGEQQRVEILRLLYRGARVLILDEPTAVLTPQEAQALFVTLRAMAGRGNGVIIITHKLHEVMSVSDRCTVLRRGRTVGTVETARTTPAVLTEWMVGHTVSLERHKQPVEPGPVALSVEEVWVSGERGTPAVRGASLQVRRGEIMGIAGVAGNGQRELAEAIAGVRKVTRGQVKVEGGLAYIPEDRLGSGLVPNLNLADNAYLRAFRTGRMADRWNYARSLLEQFDVRAASVRVPIKLLSGGNQQKLLVGRELLSDPTVIVAAQPVRGLDIAATEAVHNLLLQARAEGKAILLISEDLDELVALSDRIAVLFEGRVVGTVEASPDRIPAIGMMMAGNQSEEVREA
jgi:general nucleoside transport system ATP-binding protein